MTGKASAEELELNEQHYGTLEKFREKMSEKLSELPKLQNDYFLVRWLKARDFDLTKAQAMLEAHLEWRKEWKVDTLLDHYTPPEVFTKYYPGGLAGFDKSGSPVWVVQSAKLDMKGIALSVKREEFIRFIIYIHETLLEMMEEHSMKKGKKITQIMFINDMDGFGMSHILQQGMDQMPRMMETMERNYPEVMKTAYIVNAPRVFPIMYGIMKPFMSEATKKKINLYGSDYKAAIAELVDADTFPKYWGGNKEEDGDPRCPKSIPLGGKIPETYYLRGEDVVGDAEVTTITVGRGAHHDVTFTVGDKKKILKYVFWSMHYDIKYGVFYKKSEDEKKETLVPMERINAHQVPVDGWVKCDKPGIYFVRFDNTYSWVHSKEINHSMELVDTTMELDEVDQQALKAMDKINTQSPGQEDLDTAVYTPVFPTNFNIDEIPFVDDESGEEQEDGGEEEALSKKTASVDLNHNVPKA